MGRLNIFVKAKHWQLFMFSWGVALMYVITFLILLFCAANSDNPQNFRPLSTFFLLFPIIVFILLFTTIGWVWKVTTVLITEFEPNRVMVKFFLNSVFLVTLIGLIFSFGISFNPLNLSLIDSDVEFFLRLSAVITFASSILYLLTLGFSIDIIAKILIANEPNIESKYRNPSKLFFLIWMFPVGIWVIQPILNKIFESKNSAN